MADSRTIFLATDGWHLVLEREKNHGMIRIALDVVEAAGLRGWLAVLKNNLEDGQATQIMPVHAVGRVAHAEWPIAVEAMLRRGAVLRV